MKPNSLKNSYDKKMQSLSKVAQVAFWGMGKDLSFL